MRQDGIVDGPSSRNKTKDEVATVGLNLAKHVFHVIGCDSRSKEVFQEESPSKPRNAAF